ncbi:MAG: hypothetical protein KJN66_09415 [Bacteroidia bacterium]|nr:hypothetical protein [Bacteroidia bacterium]
MIKFFRKIRQNLLSQGKTGKYFKYAIGEILLVVIGILIALQVNNWNEKRKIEKQFKVTLDQLYTSINVDLNIIYYYQNTMKDQISMINEILEDSDSIESQLLINMLFYTETDPNAYSSETSFHLTNLKFEPSNKNQNKIAKRITTLLKNEWWNEYFSSSNKARENYIEPILKDSYIPVIPTSFVASPLYDSQVYKHTFSKKEIENVRGIMGSRKFQNALTTLKLNKTFLVDNLIIFIEDRQSILSEIKEYYPEVKLLFENIGVVGSALESGWFKSVPMTLIDEKEGVWEIKINLSKGRFKFRANDSWSQNWGENSYSPGSLQMNGKDIQVEAGLYHIRINLSNNEYFVKRL